MKLPRAYQQKAIEFGIKTNFLNADQMGLGKSLPSIMICEAVFIKSDAAALVICPKGLKLQWQGFIQDQIPTARIWIASTDIWELQHKPNDFDYVIMHFDMIPRFNDILKQYRWSTIICDEAHRIKTRTTQKRSTETKKAGKRIHITKAVKNLKSFRKLALTGTPFDKNPAEIWSILNWLDPIEFSSYWAFVEKYVSFDTDFWGKRTNFQLKDPKAFTDMLRPYMLRRTKAMVMPELPPLQITCVPIELHPKQRLAYDAIKHVKNFEVSFEELSEPMFIQHALTKLVRLLQCASDPAGLGLVAPSAKLEWLLEWIEDHPHEPILVFSRYRATAERVAQAIGADALVMGGSELGRPLVTCRRIVATIAAAAEGHDLGHVGTVIYLDSDYSSILMQQSLERIDRGNNTIAKQAIFLDAIDTVDLLVRQALNYKWDMKQLIDRFLAMETQNA